MIHPIQITENVHKLQIYRLLFMYIVNKADARQKFETIKIIMTIKSCVFILYLHRKSCPKGPVWRGKKNIYVCSRYLKNRKVELKSTLTLKSDDFCTTSDRTNKGLCQFHITIKVIELQNIITYVFTIYLEFCMEHKTFKVCVSVLRNLLLPQCLATN